MTLLRFWRKSKDEGSDEDSDKSDSSISNDYKSTDQTGMQQCSPLLKCIKINVSLQVSSVPSALGSNITFTTIVRTYFVICCCVWFFLIQVIIDKIMRFRIVGFVSRSQS